MAEALSAQALFMPWARPGQPVHHKVIGWVRSALATVGAIRPLRAGALVVVQVPPVFAPWTARLAIGRRPITLVLDAHSGAFNDPRWRWSLRLLAAVIRRSDGLIVTNEELLAGAPRVTVPLFVMHDPLKDRRDERSTALEGDRLPYAIFPASGSLDEPIDSVLAAAEILRGRVDVFVTGDSEKRGYTGPAHLTGFIPIDEYRRLLDGASAVLALSDRESTMQRAAYEALELGCPIVCSSTRVLKHALGPAAVYVRNDATSIADGVEQALTRADELRTAAVEVLASMRQQSAEVLRRIRMLGASG